MAFFKDFSIKLNTTYITINNEKIPAKISKNRLSTLVFDVYKKGIEQYKFDILNTQEVNGFSLYTIKASVIHKNYTDINYYQASIKQQFKNPLFNKMLTTISNNNEHTQLTPSKKITINGNTSKMETCILTENQLDSITLKCESPNNHQDPTTSSYKTNPQDPQKIKTTTNHGPFSTNAELFVE